MKWFLDTHIISFHMRQHPAVMARWYERSIDDLLVPAVVIAEGQYGANRAQSQRWLTSWQLVADTHTIVPFDAACADAYGRLRSQLESMGQMIGLHDCEIAATALAWQAQHPDDTITLVTDNEREFSRIEGLQVVNWVE